MISFDEAFQRLIGNEGGYTAGLPGDPGGETNWGISKRSYPHVDIKNLTQVGAKEIYHRDFWQPLADAHPAIKFQAFDFSVQSGISTAIRKLQSAVGAADDGHWGPASAKALAAMDVNDVLMIYIAKRLRFLTKCAVWKTLSEGLTNRIANQLEYGSKDN